MKIALFDLDCSLANYMPALLRDLESMRSPGEPEIEDGDELYRLEKDQPWLAARMRFVKNQPGWWLNLEPIPEGMAVFRLVQEMGFWVKVLTKGPKKIAQAWAEKLLWSQKHLGPDIDVNVTSDKAGEYGAVLYDDYKPYVEAWLAHRPRGLAIMPTKPGQRSLCHPNVVHYRGLYDLPRVRKALETVRNRKEKEPLDLSWLNIGEVRAVLRNGVVQEFFPLDYDPWDELYTGRCHDTALGTPSEWTTEIMAYGDAEHLFYTKERA